MKKTVKINAPAKINLYLDVLAKREDGYHEIESIMQAVSLCDSVEVSEAEEISLECSAEGVPADSRNLAWRAAEKFFEATGISGGARIKIEKRIPASSGLAGGSTDAAATLTALNEIYCHPLGEAELLRLGATLGADVPFCILGGTAICRGIGEDMVSIPNRCEYYIVIARGGEGVSTPAAYRALDEKFGEGLSEPFADIEKTVAALSSGDTAALCAAVYNTFERVVLPEHSVAERYRRLISESGAAAAMMSGSGPAVFGIFEDIAAAEKCAEKLRESGAMAFVCEPLIL